MKTKQFPSHKDVFLVSGGAKGITAACVVKLAERYGCGFILVGRSPYDHEPIPAWAANYEDEAELKRAAMEHLKAQGEAVSPRRIQQMVRTVMSQREIAETLAAVDAAGGRAVYVAADVTDAVALPAAVAEGVDRLGPVTGILHGAGLLADKLIQHKQAEDFDRVVSVKAGGLDNLLRCVAPENLAFLVLFSSVAGFYGNVGQADYAIANEILNKAAHRLQHRYPHCRVLVVNWGPWDGGMVTPELKRQMELRGIEVIPLDTGTELLSDLLASDVTVPQVVVGSALKPPARSLRNNETSYIIRRRLSLAANSFLRDHVIGGNAVLPTVCAVGWMVTACEQLHLGYHFLRIDNYRVLKGIVFDESLADEYLMHLKSLPGARDGDLSFDVMIQSNTDAGRPRYHYAAQITLGRETQPPPQQEAVFTGMSLMAPGAAFYEDGTLFHGLSFRGIEGLIRADEQGLVLRCRLPEVPLPIQGQFPVRTFNPYLTDVQLQSLLVWAKRVYGYGGLPLRIQQGVQYRRAEFGEITYAVMTVQSHTPRSLVADVAVYDEAGRICSLVQGAEITLSERLNQLFMQRELAVPEPRMPDTQATQLSPQATVGDD